MAKMHLPGEKSIGARPVRLRRLIGAFKSSELERPGSGELSCPIVSWPRLSVIAKVIK